MPLIRKGIPGIRRAPWPLHRSSDLLRGSSASPFPFLFFLIDSSRSRQKKKKKKKTAASSLPCGLAAAC